ncbi:presqualene diphosphate synthase HpnD [Aldersonia sp. NBC_00410]|uniref:presqualene diphosphate synthase HpnD n=1 Tax=Aldersonia sp. NBC_00410 TaxID=2975954 RepID=UPI0022590C58|nr:presqualene diphosphate synthase HpnD [Aldersonia sp. NBC_00410]MCX5043745.1 presqualene diphosphate synthase HpnD [Aldersonia sp. NBC_00410]
MTTLDDAYRTCAQITRTEAKNFYYGIRLLPAPKRSALCAVYALARRIDDIGDGDLPPARKVAELAKVRKSLEDIDRAADPVLVAVADAAQRFPVPIGAFEELIDGVQMDLDGADYADFAALVVYCRRVAGSVGRLCLAIFGGDVGAGRCGQGLDPRTSTYADQLGIALQQTNILRDVREDLLNGRIYLPRDELDAFGVELAVDDSGELVDPDARLAALLRHCTARAEDWHALGMRLVPHLDKRSAACTLAMAGIYRQLLTRITADPTCVYRERMSLSGVEKARVATAALARAAR